MITRFFLRQFCTHGALFFVIITLVFTATNLLLRLPFIHSLASIPLVMWSMLPLMVLFSLPLASSMAVHTTISTHRMHDELLMALFLPSLRKAVYKAVLFFALGCSLMYGVFVLYLAPESYHVGKKLLLKVAKEHFLHLEPHKFHTPFQGITFFFKKKEFKQKEPDFFSLLLIFTTKRNEQYFFTAQRGVFVANTLVLHNGALYTTKDGHVHVATFEQTDIDLLKFIAHDHAQLQRTQSKFLSYNHLLSLKNSDVSAFVELHKRLAQILWQFVLVLVAFILAWTVLQTSLIATVLWCGSFYLFSYVVIVLGSAYEATPCTALMIFYVTPLALLVSVGFWSFKKN